MPKPITKNKQDNSRINWMSAEFVHSQTNQFRINGGSRIGSKIFSKLQKCTKHDANSRECNHQSQITQDGREFVNGQKFKNIQSKQEELNAYKNIIFPRFFHVLLWVSKKSNVKHNTLTLSNSVYLNIFSFIFCGSCQSLISVDRFL